MGQFDDPLYRYHDTAVKFLTSQNLNKFKPRNKDISRQIK